MTSVRMLQLAANAGEPDSVLARRIDVVIAACAVVDAWMKFGTKAHHEIEPTERKLEVAVRRYRGAIKNRRKAP